MSNATERVKALLGDLQHDLSHYRQLVTLLEAQREAMLACHAEQNQRLVDELMAIYPLLAASARRRAATLTYFRLPPDGGGLLALLARLPAALCQRASDGWQQLERQARLCQQLNQRNGLLLQNQRTMLNALLHKDPQDFLYTG